MKRYDFLSFLVLGGNLIIKSTDEAVLDWTTDNWNTAKQEPNHHIRFMKAGEHALYAWKIITHFCHEGWEPMSLDPGPAEQRLYHVALRKVTEEAS